MTPPAMSQIHRARVIGTWHADATLQRVTSRELRDRICHSDSEPYALSLGLLAGELIRVSPAHEGDRYADLRHLLSRRDGQLLGTYAAACATDKQARILAHAMHSPGTRQIEVWDGATLVYARPEVVMPAMMARPTLHAAE